MNASAIGPVATNPEITQVMASLDLSDMDASAVLRPSKPAETTTRRTSSASRPIKKRAVARIEADAVVPKWRRWALVAAVAVAASVAFTWHTYVPRYRVLGQPMAAGVPVIVMLQGADQTQPMFDGEAARLVEEMPEATLVAVNAPHDSRVERRWVVGPEWSDVARSKRQSFGEVDRVIGEVRAAGVADSDIYIGGYDEGGQLALDYAATREGFEPAGMILLSAGLPPWEIDDLSALSETRAFIAHGLQDSEVQVLSSRRLASLLRESGAQVEDLSYAGGRELDRETAEQLVGFIEDHQ